MKVLEEFLNRYKIAEYEDVLSFYESFETPLYLPFEGMGSFWISGVNNDFLVIDKDVIIFKQDSNRFLQGIFRYDMSLLDNQMFKDGVTVGEIFYRDFDLELMTEIKIYQHQEETELVFAPSKKIDQIKRISLFLEGNGVKYKGEDFASLDEVLRVEKRTQLLDQRIAALVEKKQKKA